MAESAGRQRVLVGAVWLYIAYNIVASIVGYVAKLPDLPVTHAANDHISVSQVLFTNGTIMSPPLVFMVVAGLLLWGATSRRLWLARVCAVLLVLGVGLTAVDEAGGFSDQPGLYSASKWDLALTIGSVFIVAGAFVVISGLAWLYASRGAKPAAA